MRNSLKEILEQFARGETDKTAVLESLRSKAAEPAVVLPMSRQANPALSGSAVNSEATILAELIGMVSEHLKVDRSELDVEAPLEDFGFDSISLNEFASKLETRWGLEIAPADLVECNSIGALARFFAREYPSQLGVVSRLEIGKGVELPPAPILKKTEPSQIQDGASTPSNLSRATYPPIAIIGMSAVLPGSPDLDTFWQNLLAKKDLISEYPKERQAWWHGFEEVASELPMHMPRWAGTIESIDGFDSHFFNISPKEAELMDPQQRLLLQIVWHALEDAGLKPSELAGTRTGFFAGVAGEDYMQLALRQSSTVETYLSTGCNRCVLANRISYFYNWRGPNEAIDTACSSSLVAVHRAIKAIHNGECSLAVAAGVSALLCPLTFIAFSKAGMLSPDGRCKPFDERADGYVRSEGVGAVVLKPLDAAIKDGDLIYAVIRGSSSNHGGHTSSLTVPGETGQAECVLDALGNAALDPLSIGYIEAHGTGTKVGDPVELRALRKALSSESASEVAHPMCGISSIKGNLGHLEGAAGIASLIKVAFALYHKQLPGTVNFEKLNSKSDLASTHLSILKETRDWIPLLDKKGVPIPRRAGINSFGFGGSNAHVVMEESILKDNAVPQQSTALHPELIILSAKNSDRLKQVALRLLQFLEKSPQVNLSDLAFTLQFGREELSERLAIVARNHAALVSLLNLFLNGNQDPEIFTGRVRGKPDKGSVSSDDRSDLAELGRKWVGGAAIDWKSLRHGPVNQRLRLPNYPFEQRRYWFPTEHSQAASGSANERNETLHPLLDSADPDEKGVFYKILTGSEFYLNDHRFAGVALLPGVAYVEMAWAAMAQWFGPGQSFTLRNIVWVRPVRFEGAPIKLRIRVITGTTGIRFEIAFAGSSEGEWILCTQGKAALESTAEIAPDPVPWKKIRDRATETLSRQDFYAHCQSRNFQYGPSFQVMQSLSKNNGEVISHLKLPAILESDFSKFVFHPSMLDGALQGGIAGGKSNDPASQGAALPFSLGQIQLFRPLKSEMFVYGRQLESKGGPAISRNEAFLLDEQGNVLAVLRDFLSRIIPNEEPASVNHEASENSLLYAVPAWVSISNGAVPWIPGPILLFDNEKDFTANLVHSLGQPVFRVQAGSAYRAISADVYEINPADAQHYNQLFEELLVSNRVPSLILHCWSVDQSNTLRPEKRIEAGLYSLFNLTQAFIKRRNPKPLTICFAHSLGTPYDEMTDGFLRSLNLESSVIRGATVQIRERVDLSGIFTPATENQPGVSQFRRVSGGWEARRLQSVALEKSGASQIKSGGVYLITGGLGGIGKMLATYLAERYQPVLLLCGRSQVSDENTEFLNGLRASGATVSYQQCDISDLAQVTDLVLHAKTLLGGLNGVFHCAGILKDGAFSRKSFEQFEAVLRPKVLGSTNLDLATVAEQLDFFVLFSSITALIGNRGQTDYASANRYLDSFAVWREDEHKNRRRNGRTISINWPLWAEGGMSLPESLLARMRASTGMSPLPAKDGFQALEYALSLGKSEFTVFFGDKLKLRELLKIEESPAINPPQRQTIGLDARTAATPDHTVASIQSALISILAEALKFSPEELDPDAEMSEYGVDSITAMDILNRCETRFERPIDPSAIVEFPSIRTLSQYLFDLGFETRDSVPAALPITPTDRLADSYRRVDPGVVGGTAIIAVIGYACRLPASPNAEAYWENLKNGRTLVTEVPSDRWRLEDHYSPDKTATRKSISKWGAYVDGVDSFDANFFKIDDIDARVMDPQQRILLELSEELFQDSGYGRDEVKGKNIGIFMGGGESSYLDAHHQNLTDEELKHLVVNSAGNMMAARISDFYDLRGPASVMDTACSSSLVSVHTACQSIRSGECEWAIAGGAQLLPDYGPHVAFSKAGVLAPDGVPRVFDRKSNGFVLGEGFGVVLLKPLEAALRDGDDIRALILGSAVNNDGHTMGVTTPNMRAQSDVLRMAYEKAGVRTSSISMLEAHGTGTLLGDPIEIKAASEVFRQDSQDRQFCAVGSVKSNLGHLLRAAGIASVLKVVLSLRNKQIPPTLHCEDPHPRFRFEESPFFPVRELQAFPKREGVRRAAVSSFGFGGTNCHIVFEEFVPEAFDFKPRRKALSKPNFNRRKFSFAKPKSPPEPTPIFEQPISATSPPIRNGVERNVDLFKANSTDLARAIERLLVQRAARLLAVSEKDIQTQTNFMDLGIDSVALIDLAQQMEQEIQIELYPTLFFEHQNIEALAEYFTREHGDKFSSFLGISQTLTTIEPSSPQLDGVASVPIQPSFRQPEKGVRDIAIIGMAGRFSKSANIDQFWKHLQNGTDLVGEIPKDHFDFKPSFDTHPQAPNKSYCKWGSFLDDVDKFDAGFFRVSDHEAELMDPQMRILLEVMHSAAENAGLAGRIRGSRTGVYVAACFHDYGQEILRTGKTTDPFDGTGNASSMLANRPSFFWNLRGPSLTVDTACSSSLVALHLACQALRQGECEMAFASGVNLALSPQHYIYFCSIGALSPTGRCHTFDARADGYVPGEAIASVLLKPLDQAIADGDPIHAVIKGTAINHGGYTNTVTAPNPQMEAEVLVKAWEDAGIDPATLSYIEAHGTGTKLGDPVEIQGIKLAFKKFTDKKSFCAIGSAKAHLGHTESAAGIVGVIKTILAMKNRCIPAMPDFKELNPLIQLKESPLYINTASQSWEGADNNPLRAGVSSFGFGGTYAHVVLESFESAKAVASPPSQPELFVFSARTSDRLEALLKKFSSWLEDSESQRFSFSDIAFTLQTGREQMEQRITLIASSRSEALQRISEALESKRSSNLVGRTVDKNPVIRMGHSPEDLHYFQSLYGAGQFEKLGALWTWGAEIPWQKVRDISTCHRIPMPTYEFERKSYWFISRGAVTKDVLPEPSIVEQLAVTPTTNDLRSFVTNSIVRLLSLPASEVHPATHLQDIGFDSIMGMQLMKEIQENFNVRFYPSEAQLNSSLGALLDYLESQVNPPLVSNNKSNSSSVAKKPFTFVLSAPRSGSTLLRVMLAGHSGIFCPPELHLLPFSTLEERSHLLSARAPFLSEGLPRAIMELRQCDANLAIATVNEWQQKGLSTPQIYDTLRGLAGDRIVIDKSPSYAEDLKVLERSHAWFPDAKYLFLYRHPFAVMESYVRNRFDKLFQQNAADPWQAAADVWYRINRNLRALRNQLPPANYLEIRYEDLVAAPEAVSRKICTFLDIPFEPALLRPYEGRRMTDGLRAVSLSIGDPNFNDHQEIDPALAEAWRIRLSTLPNLSSEAAALARELGYSIESNGSFQLAPAQKLFLRTYRENPIWNLEHRFIFETVHPLNRERFENAWRAVIARHPTFRTRFSLDQTHLEQREILHPFSVEWSDFSRNSAEERELAIQEVISALHRSINLHEPPLIRCGIVDIGSGKYQMVCVYHHLIGDGISSAVLFEEVLKQYLAPGSAAPFEHAIELYSQRVNQLIESGEPAHETFWRKHLENYAYSNPPMDESTAPVLFSTEQEMRFAGEYLKLPNIPSFAVAAAALYQVIAEWGDSTDVVIGHRLHGRVAGSGATEDPIGCFAIDIPLRLKGAELESANVVTAFRTAFEVIPSNGITYAPLVLLGKLPAAEKLTAIRLNYQPRPLLSSDVEFKLISQTVRSVQAPEHERQYLLDFIVRAQSESWSLIVRYSTTLHREDTIRKLAGLWSARVRSLSLE